MNHFWLGIILKFIGMIAMSDLFSVQRAILARQIPPKLLTAIQFLVGILDVQDLPGKEKAAAVKEKIAQPLYGVVEEAKAAAPYLINLAIESAVGELRALQQSSAKPSEVTS